MFTGIVETQGAIYKSTVMGDDLSITVDAAEMDQDVVRPGDSISVSGVCLTVVRVEGPHLSFDISTATLQCTKLGQLTTGDKVNLEQAMSVNGRFGGHLVTGHVDGMANFESEKRSSRSISMTFRCDSDLAPYLSKKGSVCLDGVSLTVNHVIDKDDSFLFEVNVIPHTLGITTLGALVVGDKVNIEVDQIVRHIKRLHDCAYL